MLGNINKPFFIAEISSNHNGNISNAKKLIFEAKKNGADAVKLQTYTPSTMTVNSKKSYFIIMMNVFFQNPVRSENTREQYLCLKKRFSGQGNLAKFYFGSLHGLLV